MDHFGYFDNEELFAFARNDLANNYQEDALKKIKCILSRGNFPVDVLALAGKIYASIGMYERAKSMFLEFIHEVPEAFVERFQLGMVEADLGDTDEAERVWAAVIEEQPHYAPALFHLGQLLANKGELDRATEHLNTILEHAPDDSEYIAPADQLLTKLSLQ